MPALRSVARAFPSLQLAVDLPTRPADVAKRHHNAMSKLALEQVLQTHHHERIKLHFLQSAHARYGYAQRDARYEAMKRHRFKPGGVDLVKTGKSRNKMTQEGQIVIGGAAEGGKKPLEGKLRLKFAWQDTADYKARIKKRYAAGAAAHRQTQGYRAPRGHGSSLALQQKKQEVQRIISEERRAMAKQFRAEYLFRYRLFQAQRQRVRGPVA